MKPGKQRIIEALMIAGLLSLIIALALPAFQQEVPRRRPPCKNNLKQIGLALHNYHDDHGSLPPAYIADENGKPMHSWRVLILPYLDQDELYNQYSFEEPWDGPNNRKLHDRMPDYLGRSGSLKLYQCHQSQDFAKHNGMTSYVVVVGPNTVFPGDQTISLFKDITDGSSNTIMVVEVENSGIHWMEPRDLNFDQIKMTINPKSGQGISSPHEGGVHVLFCDGRVKYLSDKTSPETLRRLLEINDGEPLGDF